MQPREFALMDYWRRLFADRKVRHRAFATCWAAAPRRSAVPEILSASISTLLIFPSFSNALEITVREKRFLSSICEPSGLQDLLHDLTCHREPAYALSRGRHKRVLASSAKMAR